MSDNKKITYSAISQLTAGVLGFLIVPIYINSMGAESYGILGLLIALQSWLLILDSLLTPALSREMARFKGSAYSAVEINSLFKSMELLALAIAVIIFILFLLTSNLIVNYWITSETFLSKEFIVQCIRAMGLIIGLKLLEEFYAAALIGLEEQVGLAKRKILSNIAKHVGGVIVAVSFQSIQFLLYWHIFIGLCVVIAIRLHVRNLLPKLEIPSKFDLTLLRKIQKFSGGMIILSIINVGITNSDKIILVSMISLEDYGYYIFGVTLASSLYFISGPIISTYYPQFVKHASVKNSFELIGVYNRASIKLITYILPLVATIFFYGDTIIEIWTRDTQLTNAVFPLVKVLIIGTYVNTLTWIPYHIQLAYGNVVNAVKINIFSLVITFIGLSVVIPLYGSLGAVWIWLLSNVILLILNYLVIKKLYMPKNTYISFGFTFLSTMIIFGMGALYKFLTNNEFNNFIYKFILTALFFLICLSITKGMSYIFKLTSRKYVP